MLDTCLNFFLADFTFVKNRLEEYVTHADVNDKLRTHLQLTLMLQLRDVEPDILTERRQLAFSLLRLQRLSLLLDLLAPPLALVEVCKVVP